MIRRKQTAIFPMDTLSGLGLGAFAVVLTLLLSLAAPSPSLAQDPSFLSWGYTDAMERAERNQQRFETSRELREDGVAANVLTVFDRSGGRMVYRDVAAPDGTLSFEQEYITADGRSIKETLAGEDGVNVDGTYAPLLSGPVDRSVDRRTLLAASRAAWAEEEAALTAPDIVDQDGFLAAAPDDPPVPGRDYGPLTAEDFSHQVDIEQIGTGGNMPTLQDVLDLLNGII